MFLAIAVVNLTLIDLPGLTKVAVGKSFLMLRYCLLYSFVVVCVTNLQLYILIIEGQPDSIVHDIENMVRSFIEKVRLYP